MSAPTPPDDLQFTTAEPAALTPDSDAGAAIACAECGQPIPLYYFTVAGRTLCGTCKGKVERALAGEGTSRAGRIARALAYGLGAALAGAAIWFAVAVVFDLEIGLIAILIGWMVGRAVRAGSAHRGGRRYQVAAALLTYLSVAMSYGALGIRELAKGESTPAATADSAATAKRGATTGGITAGAPATADAPTAPSASTTASAVAPTDSAAAGDSASANAPVSGGDFAKAVAFMLGFMFVLPIIANLSSMPGGLLGLAIMAFGIMQAWKMNAALDLSITGPHRIGAAPDAPPSTTLT